MEKETWQSYLIKCRSLSLAAKIRTMDRIQVSVTTKMGMRAQRRLEMLTKNLNTSKTILMFKASAMQSKLIWKREHRRIWTSLMKLTRH